jgi:hypothetical protein
LIRQELVRLLHWLEEIREDLLLKYERFQRARQSNRDKEETRGETALYARAQFKGKCQGSGKYGHKVANCPDKKEKDGSGKTNGNKTVEFKGKCFNAMKLATRCQVVLIKGRITKAVDMMIPRRKLPCVGKEMPISRIVIAVPNTTVFLLD